MGGLRLYFLLLAAVLLSGLAALVPSAWTGADVLESSYREYAVRDMTANANLLALAAEPYITGQKDPAGLPALLRTARDGSHTRFTVITRDGAVLADSDEEAARMENHANRSEIQQALAGKTGTDIRESPTLGTEWIYTAIPLPGGGAVRAAASLDELNVRLSEWWKRALTGFLLSLLLLACLALLAARTLSRPLEVAAAAADRYAGGDFSARLPVSGSAEMRRLAHSLGEMARELDARFRMITHQREEMHAVFENMAEGILAAGMDGRILLLNAAAEKMLNIPAGSAGKNLQSVTRDAELLDVVRDTAAAGSLPEKEIRVSGGTDTDSLLQVHSVVMREDGRDVGILAVMRDVTRLRQLEIMRRDFVANVSHELRTPITTVQSCLETLLEGGAEDKETTDNFLEMALRNTRRMGSIIDNLLFLAGMESGTRDAGTPVRTPVLPVLEEALSVCREEAEARRVKFRLHCGEGLTAVMNPQLVLHAVINLIDNAVKYGPEDGGITVTASETAQGTEIVVSDEGPGIAPKYQSRVFERFYRVNGSSRVREGSGLGLSLVKHIALAQGGNITLESEIGAGSTFKLTLPNQ